MVIGYGNVLRGDDGVGPAVVELLRSRQPDVQATAEPMLVPELAAQVAGARVVVFVDARVDGVPGEIRVEPVVLARDAAAVGHLLSAATLMALAARLYGCRAPAFQISVAGRNFDVGARMSKEVEAALPRAAEAVVEILRGRV